MATYSRANSSDAVAIVQNRCISAPSLSHSPAGSIYGVCSSGIHLIHFGHGIIIPYVRHQPSTSRRVSCGTTYIRVPSQSTPACRKLEEPMDTRRMRTRATHAHTRRMQHRREKSSTAVSCLFCTSVKHHRGAKQGHNNHTNYCCTLYVCCYCCCRRCRCRSHRTYWRFRASK